MPSATSQIQCPDGRVGGSDYKIYPEASGQSFIAGALVKLVSGKVTVVAGTSGSALEYDVIGLAVSAASGTVDTDCLIKTIDSKTLLSVCIYASSASNAVTAVAAVGTILDVKNDSGKHCVNYDSSSYPMFLIKGIDLAYATGTAYGRYLCNIIPARLLPS